MRCEQSRLTHRDAANRELPKSPQSPCARHAGTRGIVQARARQTPLRIASGQHGRPWTTQACHKAMQSTQSVAIVLAYSRLVKHAQTTCLDGFFRSTLQRHLQSLKPQHRFYSLAFCFWSSKMSRPQASAGSTVLTGGRAAAALSRVSRSSSDSSMSAH